MKKQILFFIILIFLFAGSAQAVFAHRPMIIFGKSGDIKIEDPEISNAFYDDLLGSPRNYIIESKKDFKLYLNILVPDYSNHYGRYSAKVFLVNGDNQEEIAFLDGQNFEWKEFYEPFGRDYYLKGPEFEKQVPAGKYRIEVFGNNNQGKYVLASGDQEKFAFFDILSVYWTLPFLKIQFFKTSVLEFFLTPFGLALAGLVVFVLACIALINFIKYLKEKKMKIKPNTMILASIGANFLEGIIKIVDKPLYDITVAFITTASKPEKDKSFMEEDKELLHEAGFNVEEIDIEGKSEGQLYSLLHNKDVIFVEGGNTFYLLKCMKESGFKKVIKKLFKKGVLYVGTSAGSVVMGKTIDTAGWGAGEDENIVRLSDLRGFGFVPFNIFVHYNQGDEEIIKQNTLKSRHPLKVLTDSQALLVIGKDVALIGKGEEIKFNKTK